jgi:VCBS repeat-containing protein
MTVAEGTVRRLLLALVAAAMLFGVLTVVAIQRAEAAYPGGSNWVVFENSDGGDNELWAIPADGSAVPVNLTNDLSFQADPAFSPDGTKLAFASDHGATSSIYVATFNPAGPSINVIGSWVQVTSGGTDGEPTWSPDGTQIAFERWFDFSPTGAADSDSATNLTDATATFVTDGVYAGAAITNETDGNTVGLVASVVSETELETTGIAWTTADTYSIDVSHARVFTAAADGSDAGTETQLGETPSTPGEPSYTDRYPAWDPTGSLIAFTSGRNGNDDIYTFTTAGATPANLTDDGVTGIDTPAIRPSWAPDGQSIVFQTYKPSLTYQSLWKVDRAGTAVTQITTSTDGAVAAAWSPDGTKIAYQNGTNGVLYVIPAAGGTAVALTTAGTPTGPHNTPDWQPALAAVADTGTVAEGGSVNIDVLANDLALVDDVGAATTSATLVDSPDRGSAVRQSDGSFTYTHGGSETTSDSFTYTLTQGSFTSTAVVTVTINPVNDAPTAGDDEYAVSHAATLTVTAPNGVLKNDTDPEGSGLSAAVASGPAQGTLTLNADGSFTYTNDGSSDAATTDSFTYTASDGSLSSAPATVTINVASANPDAPTVSISGPSFGASGIASSFSSTVDGFGTFEYEWTAKVGGATVATGTDPTFSFTPATTGVYTVAVTVTDTTTLTGADSVELTVLTDINGSIFKNDIVWLANEGVTKGCNPPVNDEYCPNDNVTRGQMAAFLVRFLDLTDQDPAIDFVDDNGSVFEDNIEVLATAGITRGCNPPTNDEYCPNDNVTRGQMAAFLVRALGLTDDGGGDLFTDDDGSVFENNIDVLATAGITKGCNVAGDEFCPNDYVTRGQMAAFLHRADDLR